MNQGAEYQYDVFLSHSTFDKPIVLDVAGRLESAGLKVWMDSRKIQPGDMINKKIEEGLEESRVLLLFLSSNAYASEWVTMERNTAFFSDPTNEKNRVIPIRLDDAPMKPYLNVFSYIDWRREEERDAQFGKLLATISQNSKLKLPWLSKRKEKEEVYKRRLAEMISDRLRDQYDIEKEPFFPKIMEGEDADILFKGFDRHLQRFITLIVPYLSPGQSENHTRIFYEKMRRVAQLKHRNIMTVYAGLDIDGLPILIREYVPGVTLQHLIERIGPQPLYKIYQVLRQIGEALDYAHTRGRIHHRLAPENILLDADGEPVITPFRIVEGYPRPKTEDLLYQNPGRFVTEIADPQQTDQYALGLIALEMLAGKRFWEIFEGLPEETQGSQSYGIQELQEAKETTRQQSLNVRKKNDSSKEKFNSRKN